MTVKFDIRELSYPCVLRKRGLEASNELMKRMKRVSDVEIDLRNVEILSLSFLDELIFRTYVSGKLESVVFKVHDKDMEKKLEQISAIRSISIKYHLSNNDVRRAVPKSTVKHLPSYAESKNVLV